MNLETLPQATQEALSADLADMDGNSRIVKQPAVTVISTKPHACKACGETIPARMVCVSRTQLTTRKKWTWHFHLECTPFADVRPLAERRALRWLAQALSAAHAAADVPETAWTVFAALRNSNVPF